MNNREGAALPRLDGTARASVSGDVTVRPGRSGSAAAAPNQPDAKTAECINDKPIGSGSPPAIAQPESAAA